MYLAVGNYAGRGVRNLDDYYVAGRRAPTLLIVGTLVASFLSTNTFLGDAGFLYGFNTGRLLTPALFLVGANEKIYSPQEAVERLGRVAPQIQAEIIHDAGHDLTFVQAELVNQRVLAFLSQS